MQEETTTEQFDRLGVLLLLDCPEGLEFGIDNISWQIGNKFKGVKLIPLGTHIIAYALKAESHMFKISRFILFTPENRVHIYRWNEEIEEFLEVRGEEGEGYKEGVKQYHFDTHLGPYPNDNFAFWSQTTRYITKPVLAKLDPIDKLQQFQQEYTNKKKTNHEEIELGRLTLDDEDDEQQIINEDAEEIQEEEEEKANDNPGKFSVLSDTIYYSGIPRALTASPGEITQMNLDKTPILVKILQREWKNQQEHFLGELQYSFVHFIIGQVEDSLTQWKKIVDLLVTAQSAYLRIPPQNPNLNLEKLAMDFIPVFYDQLNQFPSDFFRDELSKGNFVCACLRRLHEYSKGDEYNPKIQKRIIKLLQLVSKKFEYTVDSGEEDDEDKPVVVEERECYF